MAVKSTARKVMISQPMAGKTVEDIQEVREHITAKLEENDYTVVDTFFIDQGKAISE